MKVGHTLYLGLTPPIREHLGLTPPIRERAVRARCRGLPSQPSAGQPARRSRCESFFSAKSVEVVQFCQQRLGTQPEEHGVGVGGEHPVTTAAPELGGVRRAGVDPGGDPGCLAGCRNALDAPHVLGLRTPQVRCKPLRERRVARPDKDAINPRHRGDVLDGLNRLDCFGHHQADHRRFSKPRDLAPLLRVKKPELNGRKRRLEAALTVYDLRRIAERRTPKPAFDYVEGAAEAEISLARARQAFEDIEFHPSALRDVSRVDTSVDILGGPSALPFGIAPTGFTRMMQAEGEYAGAAAAGAAGIPFSLSTRARSLSRT